VFRIEGELSIENGPAHPIRHVLVHGVPTFHGLMPLPEADQLANR